MKTRLALHLLPFFALTATLTSCQLPPRYAMREIQTKGLFNYLTSDYSSVSPSYYSSAAPFQLQRPYAEPRPQNPVPYRSTYKTNRNLRAYSSAVPYRPKTDQPDQPKIVPPADTGVKIDPELPTSATTTTLPPGNGTPSNSVTKVATENLPYGTPVSGRPGMVTSPFAQRHQLVDVSGLAPGDAVKDPYSGRLFRVPPTQQAAEKVTSTPLPPPTEKQPESKPEEAPAESSAKPNPGS